MLSVKSKKDGEMSKHLEVINLSKSFEMHILSGKKITAFHDISFTTERGRFLGVIGKNGSGKSSLLRCIYRNYDSTSGDIFLYDDGNRKTNLVKINDHEVPEMRRTRIGYVSQFFRPIPRTTAVNVVIEPLLDKGWGREEAQGRAKELFRLFDFPENLWDAFPSTFSGGEKQRINLIRCLINSPELVLLDEPTASLDVKSRGVILDIIKEMTLRKITILCVFHNEPELERLADDILDMDHAKVTHPHPPVCDGVT